MEYTIWFRTFRSSSKTALIVAEGGGTDDLFSGGRLHCAAYGARPLARLQALLSGTAIWHPVPPVAPYTLTELCALLDTRLAVANAA